jgi:hypothetical protein
MRRPTALARYSARRREANALALQYASLAQPRAQAHKATLARAVSLSGAKWTDPAPFVLPSLELSKTIQFCRAPDVGLYR